MGPSGSGKSSLLQLCSGRRLVAGVTSTFSTTGAITLNDAPLSARTRHLAELVPQSDDWLLSALTPRETLRYAAALKLPSHVSRKRKHARAEEVLRLLGLNECADTPCGGELLKGISGGEKRRLALGVQMIGEPAVLFADEPVRGARRASRSKTDCRCTRRPASTRILRWKSRKRSRRLLPAGA
jgi:ABC-type multidrug transport system ATPase subunit